MDNNRAGFKHYFDPEPSSTLSNADTAEEQSQAQDWVSVERSGRSVSSTKFVASAFKYSNYFGIPNSARSYDEFKELLKNGISLIKSTN